MDKCQSCGAPHHIDDLDAKPRRLRKGAADAARQLDEIAKAMNTGEPFDWLEGPCCYGPGYSSLRQ